MLNPKMVVAFVALADAYGMAWCIDILDHWSKPDAYRQTNMIEQFPQTIKKLVKHSDKVQEIIQWLLDYQFETLKKNHALNKQRSNLVALNRESPTRINAVLDLLKGSIAASNPKFHRMVLDHVIANEALYPVLGLVSFLQRLIKQRKGKEGDWGHEKLYQYLNQQLSREINIPPRRKDDGSIRERIGCDCNDCKTLGQFLQSNILKTKTWPLAQARRGHIHSMIEGMGLPISHQTERQGRPYKLVLNKTDQLFLQEENHRLSLQKALSNLTKVCAGNS